MGVINLSVFKEAWVDSDIGSVSTSLVSAINAKDALIDTLHWEGSRVCSVQASGVEFDYAKYNLLKTQIDNYCSANGIDVRAIAWSA